MADRSPGDTRQEIMSEAVDVFHNSAYKTREEIEALSPALLALGKTILQNRKSLTYDTVSAAASILTTLPGTTMLTLWDNLFYQTSTMESGYVREAILQMLLANHMVRAFASVTPDDDAMIRKLANSRIVMPNELFGVEDPFVHTTTGTSVSPDTSLIKSHLATAESHFKAGLGIAALEDLVSYKKKHFESRVMPEEIAQMESYQKDLAEQIKTAPVTVAEDPFSGNIVKTITLKRPRFTYTREPEINEADMNDGLPGTASYLISELGLYSSKSYAQMEQGLKDYIRKQQNEAFGKTPFFVEQTAIDGTILSLPSLEARSAAKYSFCMKAVKRSGAYHNILMSVDTGSPDVKLTAVRMSVGSEFSGMVEKFDYTNKDGIVTVNVLPSSTLIVPNMSNVQLSATLNFSDGLMMTLPSLNYNLLTGITGLLNVSGGSYSRNDVFVPSGYGVTRLGIADYRKVEQKLCCYVPGEVSHIENVMAREYKERSTRRLRRTEDTTTTTSSSESERMTDTTTTSRFDMQQEISKVLSESRESSKDVSAHAGVEGSIPTVGSFDASLDYASNFATSTSQEMSEHQSTQFAKEITEKALQRVVSKVSEERSLKIIEEFEEQNRHGFDNRQGAEHISGVYRWVDKIYKNEIHNYGKRLQYEFMIPEPGSFHLTAKTGITQNNIETPLKKPLDPRSQNFGLLQPITHAGLITENNYQQWAAAYGATIMTPPETIKVVAKTLIRPQDGSAWHESKVVSDEIILPEGYGLKRAYITATGNGDNSGWERYYITVGSVSRVYWTDQQDRFLHLEDTTTTELEKFTESVPVAAQFTGLDGGIVSFELELMRRDSFFADWQLETFNAIISAYESRLQEYKDAVAEQEVRKGVLMGDNPAYLRRIENTVLKKNCIEYLVGYSNIGKAFVTGNDIRNTHVRVTSDMDKYAALVKFFEQAFEWDLMDYRFYPFYWANREKWSSMYGIDNDDALFRSFLQSGMARTILTVRPGFEEAVMYYMATGQVWNGGEVPVLGDDLYLSIIDELSMPEYVLEETWETRVPSSLTLIQAKTIALNAEGLPCYCDEDNAPEETIEQPENNPLENLPVHIDGVSTPGGSVEGAR